jgi:hypothetical protein
VILVFSGRYFILDWLFIFLRFGLVALVDAADGRGLFLFLFELDDGVAGEALEGGVVGLGLALASLFGHTHLTLTVHEVLLGAGVQRGRATAARHLHVLRTRVPHVLEEGLPLDLVGVFGRDGSRGEGERGCDASGEYFCD